MAIPYPKRSGGPSARRPSTRGGRVPQFPANDLRPLASPSGPQVNFPKYGNPVQRNPVPKPNFKVPNPFGGVGSKARLFIPFAAPPLFELYDFLSPLWTKTPDPKNRFPMNGFWEKRYGDFGPYGSPYADEALWMSTNTWHQPISGQAFTGYSVANPWIIPETHQQYGIWYRKEGVVRYAHHSSYFRTTNRLNADNGTFVWPTPGISPYPGVDPLSTPIGVPSGAPASVPYPAIPHIGANPYRSPIEQTGRGNAPPLEIPIAPGTGFPGRPWEWGWEWNIPIAPLPASPGKPDKVQQPGVGPGIGTGTQPAVGPSPFGRPGGARPPAKGTKERKVFSTGDLWILKKVGALGETADFIDAMWKALPKEAKHGYYKLHKYNPVTGQREAFYKYRHRANMQEKAKDLYDNYDKLDLVNALRNFLENQMEDLLIGGLGQAQNAGRKRSKIGGVDVGPAGRGYTSGMGYYQQARNVETAQYLSDKAKYGKKEAIYRSQVRRSALGRQRFSTGRNQSYGYHIGWWG